MSEKRAPWLKWYPADWRADPRLRMCSLAARGLWIELIGFMHEAERYGFLLVAGTSPTIEELVVLVGAPAPLIRKALAELQERDVFSRDGDGVIFSRRMVRDKAKADKDRENGKGGGNPTLRNDDKPPDKADDNPWVNPPDKAQIPEARVQKEKEPPSADGAPSLEAEVFRRGKKLLGKSAGGQITKLRRCLTNDDMAALAVLNEAAAKENPAEWVAGVIRRRTGEGETDELGLPKTPISELGKSTDELYRRMGIDH